MACNCGKNKTAQRRTFGQGTTPSGGVMRFTLTDRHGKVQQFGSRLEADAANARLGYTGIVKRI